MTLSSGVSFDYINDYLYNNNDNILTAAFTYDDNPSIRIPYVGFTAGETQAFVTALNNAVIASPNLLPQIRLFMAMESVPGQRAHFTPILQIHTGSPDQGFLMTINDFSSIPSDFVGYRMTTYAGSANDTSGTATLDPKAPVGSTELTDAQKTTFVDHYKSYQGVREMFVTTSGAIVQHYSFTGEDSRDLANKAVAMGNCILRCVMGANPPTSDHPVKFRPILELVNDSQVIADVSDGSSAGDTYWDYSNPCPPNCSKG